MTLTATPDVTDVVDKNAVAATAANEAAQRPFGIQAKDLVRHEDETTDLIAECRKILTDHMIPAEQLAVYDSSPTLNNAKTLTTFAQRIALNQFWHLQMGPFGQLSHVQRFKLIENGSTADWLKLFAQGPVQFIIDNKLPVPL